MERRNFLKGLFGGVTAAGLVVAAKPDEIEAFASPLVKNEPIALAKPSPDPEIVEAGEHLYNAEGRLVAIVTSVNVTVDRRIEVTSFGDDYQTYFPASMRFDIQAQGVGSVEWQPQKAHGLRAGRLRLKG